MTRADTDAARDLAVARSGVSVRDAIHTAVMRNHGIGEIATFDAGFDRIPDVERVELR